jgi:hypothetical protein
MLRQVDRISKARRERRVMADGIVPAIIWVVLFGGAFLTVGFTFFFEGRAQPTLSVIRGRGLSVCPEQFLHRLHDRHLQILKTIISELFRIGEESLSVQRRITTFAVVIAAKPDGDVLRTGNFVAVFPTRIGRKRLSTRPMSSASERFYTDATRPPDLA